MRLGCMERRKLGFAVNDRIFSFDSLESCRPSRLDFILNSALAIISKEDVVEHPKPQNSDLTNLPHD